MRNTYDEDRDEFLLNEGVTAAIQLRTLRSLFRCISEMVNRNITPIVEIDLDLTSLMPINRTIRALREVGTTFGIKRLIDAESLPTLPGYSDEAWRSFVELMDFQSTHKELAWTDHTTGPFALFHEKYWTTSWICTDMPTPGLGAFVHRVNEEGGKVVFISGRWLPEHIEASLLGLKRAGIAEPQLVIGNAWHPSLVSPEKSLSDAQIKVMHQDVIQSQYGVPVAIIDDRITNRKAIMESLQSCNTGVLGIAVCIPGFTYDSATDLEGMKISTFEMFDYVVGDPPDRPYMTQRYRLLGSGRSWHGLYEGLGRNKCPYILPRLCRSPDQTSLIRPFADLLLRHPLGTLVERRMIALCINTIPNDQVEKLTACMSEAKRLAEEDIAAPFPETEEEAENLWLCLVTSWLHSRDLDCVMNALGYGLNATGIHDLDETVAGREIKVAIASKVEAGARYSPWLLNWVRSITDAEPVNVGCLNPSLIVGLWRWRPQSDLQDAMDIHRLSSHHEGDKGERYDPIEAAVNNVLHQREGVFGIRKEPTESWEHMLRDIKQDRGAEALSKSLVGREVVRDAIKIASALEGVGSLTPWGLTNGS